MTRILLFVFTVLFFYCCKVTTDSLTTENKEYSFSISELTDEEYPDNPDIGYRSQKYDVGYFKSGALLKSDNNSYDLVFRTYESHGDSIIFNSFDLMEYIPTIPQNFKTDDYLSYLTVINQEWNRNQVRFSSKEYTCNNERITRVDVARNCLNAYLWEVIAYIQEEGMELPIYHGWFNFPKQLYADLFLKKNGVSIEQFLAGLEKWKNPKNAPIQRDLLRKSSKEIQIEFADLSDSMYPIKGERERKYREIIHPEKFTSMRDLQNDATTFATFSQPGFYNRKDPRKTELGRLYNLIKIKLSEIISAVDSNKYHEIELEFSDKEAKRTSKLQLGGLNFSDFPTLSPEDANEGWKTSMGFSNHTFYEDYKTHESCKMSENPYYGYFTDQQDRWLDSHRIGIDGPLVHWDDQNPKLLHVWLLSFERHALVGHYTLLLK